MALIPIFDLDGTLIDSDEALVQAFLDLGITRKDITFGLPAEAACVELGVSIDDYVQRYDTESVQPFAGAESLVASLGRWGVCSNKHPGSGHAELQRLGWVPEVVCFTDAFEGRPKYLDPVLAAMNLEPDEIVFVGDTLHDHRCAAALGARFVWAGWNPRCVADSDLGLVLDDPRRLLDLLG